ncbi:serine protease [Variovorax sp. GrIS 2.14]|uniref:S1 family peptidase n=1 Tax=Variovorax sp. GrIS 2.14 TaxID=3071709 RepID=UPI0038F70717
MLQDPTTRWGKNTFLKYRGCVGFIASEAPDGTAAVGSCFHVGDGVFVTARHVVEGRKIIEVGFDDDITSYSLLANPKHWGPKLHGSVTIGRGPLFHDDPRVDLACFVAEPFPKEWIPLGGHLDEYLGQFELVLYRTLVLGHPPIQMSRRPILVASLGEINALAELYSVPHPHFIVSCMARGGFSGGPALVAYNEANDKGGTAALGVVTQALCRDGQPEQLGYMAVITVEPVYAMLESHGLLPGAQSLTIDTSS